MSRVKLKGVSTFLLCVTISTFWKMIFKVDDFIEYIKPHKMTNLAHILEKVFYFLARDSAGKVRHKVIREILILKKLCQNNFRQKNNF